MNWNFSKIAPPQRYKLLVGLVVPRPIALISTLSSAGVVNAAPFSFFNAMGDDPPILIVSIERHADGRIKDTERNIRDSGEFVVNLVDESIAEPMHATATELPPEQSEFDWVGFTQAPSSAVAPPRIVEAPVSLECKQYQTIDLPTRCLVIGEVLWLHAREGVVDPDTLRVCPAAYHPIGRLYGSRYTRTRDQFEVAANAYNERMAQLGRT